MQQEEETVVWEPKEVWSLEEGSQRSGVVWKQQGAGIYAWNPLSSCPLISSARHWLTQERRNPGEADPQVGILRHRVGQRRVEKRWGQGVKEGDRNNQPLPGYSTSRYLRVHPRML